MAVVAVPVLHPGAQGMGGIYLPNIFGSVGNFLFHSVKIAAVGKSRNS